MELFPYQPLGVWILELRDTVTAYDGRYLALVEGLGVPFVTLGARLARASGPRCRILLPPAPGVTGTELPG